MQEAKVLAEKFLESLQTVNFEDATDFVANVLSEFQSIFFN